MNAGKNETTYEALYECLSSVPLSAGNTARPGDLTRESELSGKESILLAHGQVRLVGYVRRGARMK